MQRISIADLERIVARLNERKGYALEPYADGEPCPNVYHLSRAYGGVALHQMMPTGTGTRDVLSVGHTSKLELYHLLHAYIRGIETCN